MNIFLKVNNNEHSAHTQKVLIKMFRSLRNIHLVTLSLERKSILKRINDVLGTVTNRYDKCHAA
jgi:hypothetical protein